MKKYIVLVLVAILLFTGCSVLTPEKTDTPVKTLAPLPTGEPVDPSTVDEIYATIEMESGGKIVIQLFPKLAPQSVCNFVSLARQGFYDGLTFHRVMSGFMVQGGDPKGNGTGGPGYCIKGEFSLNGFDNSILHIRGTISCARKGDPYYDSCGSQFFIVHKDTESLNGNYAAFGRVTEGMEYVDEIAAVEVGSNNLPLTPVVIKSITIDGPLLPEPEKLPEV